MRFALLTASYGPAWLQEPEPRSAAIRRSQGALSLAFFSLGKQRKKHVRGAPAAF
jgi:hypothetical protein